jgi:HAD superfamily hydrolase (TIGR01662 family)
MKAVLFDRDGTLIVDVPGNRNPQSVELMSFARESVDGLRDAGLRIAVITNQPGNTNAAAINDRTADLLGGIDAWFVCGHLPHDGCDCRKPKPGMVFAAARRFGVSPAECIVVGDIGSDIEAAHAAGARAIIVPTPITLPQEVARAPERARDLREAVRMILGAPA